MAMVINSNIQSLNAQRHLNNSLDAQNTATERLSSGLRINSAKDDAAGLAIANRMTSQVQGLNQAVRNANDGAALIQTAEGGLEETTNILQRMRELSIQSANGTYDTGNRDTLNAEVKQLKLEIDRISETTSFNGLNILDGSLGSLDLQVGENANQTIGLEIGASNTKTLGSGSGADVIGNITATTALVNITGVADAVGDWSINGVDLGDLSGATTLEDALGQANGVLDGAATIGTFVDLSASAAGSGVFDSANVAGGITLTVTNIDGTTAAFSVLKSESLEDLAAQINEAAAGSALTASVDDGKLSFSAENVDNLVLAGTSATAAILGTGVAAGTTQARLSITDAPGGDGVAVYYLDETDAILTGIDKRDGNGTITGSIVADPTSLTALEEGDIQVNGVDIGAYDPTVDYNGDALLDESDFLAVMNADSSQTGVVFGIDAQDFLTATSLNGGEISVKYDAGSKADIETNIGFEETNSTTGGGSTVSSIDISSAEGAQKAIGILDAAIKEVSSIRGDLGAISNRLDYTTRNLSNISENAASARSQIMDADFAAESANLSRAQVLQQAGNAMLAQANSRPQQVLSLLQ